jgi:hypothetical protein
MFVVGCIGYKLQYRTGTGVYLQGTNAKSIIVF